MSNKIHSNNWYGENHKELHRMPNSKSKRKRKNMQFTNIKDKKYSIDFISWICTAILVSWLEGPLLIKIIIVLFSITDNISVEECDEN